MNRHATLGLLLALATACPADPEPDDTQGSTTTSVALTDSTLGPDDCGTGDCCQVNPNFCETTGGTTVDPGDSTSTSASSSTAGTSSEGTTSGETGPGVEPPCGFQTTLEGFAMGKTEPTDCGTVTLDDDVAAWQAASECAAAAAAAQEGFLVAFQLPSDDSLVFEGFYGTVGFTYSLGRLYTDTFGDPMLASQSCDDVTTLDGCTLEVGTHCLTCVGGGESVALECPM